MKIKKSDLERMLRTTLRNINGNDTSPVLEMYYFHESATQLTILSTNLFSGTRITQNIQDGKKQSYCLPVKMYDLMKLLPEQEIELTILENQKARVTCKSGIYEFSFIKGEDYPTAAIEAETYENEVRIPADKLLKQITTVEVAAGKKGDVRQFDIVFAELIDGELLFTATEGHTLCSTNREIKPQEAVTAMLTVSSCAVLKSVLAELSGSEVVVRLGKKTVEIASTGLAFRTMLAAKAKYPEYRMVIPQDSDIRYTFNRTKMIKIMTRMMSANQDQRKVRFTIGENSTTVTGAQTGEEIIESKIEGAEGFTFHMNAELFKGMLNNFTSEDLTLLLTKPDKAALIKDSHLFLIMPQKAD